MRLLLDTHTFIRFVEGDGQLSHVARLSMEDQKNEILLSMACIWEMAIKVSLAKLDLLTPDKSFETHVTERLQQNGFGVLPITLGHVFRVSTLDYHHRDPFDRLLVAQSLEENIPIISVDAALDAYGVERLW